MKGYTLVELVFVMTVLGIIAAIGIPMTTKTLESHRVNATVETMYGIAAAADIARRLPGGDIHNNVSTSVIAAMLNSYDVNHIGMPTTPMTTHWGDQYRVNTTGPFATVNVSIPVSDISPFKTKSVSNGIYTTLTIQHRPESNNRAAVLTSTFTKKYLYLE